MIGPDDVRPAAEIRGGRWGGRARCAQVGALGLALLLWAASLRRVDLDSITDLGLVSVLPPTFGLGLVILSAGFWSVLTGARPNPWLLLGYTGALVLMIHGTTAVLYAEPRYTYVYKHIGVVNYINLHGGVDRGVDIYQNWPGFFTAVAVLSKVSGVSALAFANWAQVFFAGCDALALRFVAAGLTNDPRRISCTVWLYLLADWVGQNYLAPQAFGFLTSLTALGLVLHHLGPVGGTAHDRPPRRRPRAARTMARLAGVADTRPDHPAEIGSLGQPTAVGLVLFLSGCVVVSHQLSPLLLSVALAVLVACGRCRIRWLPVAVLAMTLAWFGLAHTILAEHFRLFADVGHLGGNSGGTGTTPGSPGHEQVARFARALSLAVVMLAAVGWLARARAGRRETTAAALAASPIPLVFAQSYGGEGIYRVYLFALPWCCFLASGALTPRPKPPSRRRAAAGLAVVLGLLPLLLVAYLGLERVNYVRPEEVALERWFEEHAPSGSVLAQIGGNGPAQQTGNYDQFFLPDGNWGTDLVDRPPFAHRKLTAADVPAAVQELHRTAAQVYVLVSPGQEAYTAGFGLSPRGAVDRFGQLLLRRPEFRIVRRQGTSALLQLK